MKREQNSRFRAHNGLRPPFAQFRAATITVGVRRPLGITDGLQRLVDLYNETTPQKIAPEAVIVHELLLHLNWLAEAAERKRNKDAGGHGPDHYAGLIRGILRRAKA
jgi:hypothetical protein